MACIQNPSPGCVEFRHADAVVLREIPEEVPVPQLEVGETGQKDPEGSDETETASQKGASVICCGIVTESLHAGLDLWCCKNHPP